MDDNKKPGPRDITDLKARLGLKKPGAPGGAAPQPGQQPPQGGGPAAPHGQAPRRDPFAAPGQQQAAPRDPFAPPQAKGPGPAQPKAPRDPFGPPGQQQPAPPAGRDPFAGQAQPPQAHAQAQANLAAFYGIGQTIPGSADGVPEAPLGESKASSKILMYAAIAAIPFIVGIAFGRIMRDRIEYNTTTDQAAQIRDEVEKMGKQVRTVVEVITSTPAGRKGDLDLDVNSKLAGLDLKKPDTTKIFHTNYASLEPVVVERLMQYYDNTLRLFDQIDVHTKKTEHDKDALVRAQKEGAKSDKNYGVIVKPQNGLMLAEFVEVGQPVCNDPSKKDCSANDLKGFQYRLDSGQSWGQRPVKGATTAIVMPLQQTPFFKTVAAGNPDFLALKDYVRRMAEIRNLSAQIMNQQKDVANDLKKASERPHMFAL